MIHARAVESSRFVARRKPIPSGGNRNAAALLRAGIERQQAGDLAAAAGHYRAALAKEPGNADALHLLGVACYLAKDPAGAVELLRQARQRAPGNAEISSNLGASLHAVGDLAGAAEAFRAATVEDPGKTDAHANLAAVLAQTDQAGAAIDSFAAAHRLAPENPHFIKRLGELCLGLERFEEAALWFGRYLERQPDDADALCNAAFACDRMARPSEAETRYRRALALRPQAPEIAYGLGALLARTDRAEEAEKLFAHAFAAPPEAWRDPADHARALCNRARFDEAVAIFAQLAATRPGDAALNADYANALTATGRHADAAETLTAALAAEPGRHDLRIALARCLLRDGRTDDAIRAYGAVPAEAAEYLLARLDLCLLLANERRYREAAPIARAIPEIPGYQPGLFLRPYVVLRECCDFDGIDRMDIAPAEIAESNLASSAGNFLELLPWAESETQIAALADLHRRRGAAIARETAAPPPAPAARRADERLRLGFISSDLRRHSVARFVLPLVEHYDRERLEIFCYSPREDADDDLQQRIRARTSAFRVVGGLSDQELAAAIRDDRIDVLFELNGFTAESRLSTLAWRAAPVQVYWLGYPFTTGMKGVDYILLDEHLVPADPSWLSETPLIIEGSFVCYDALEEIEPAPAPPSVQNGFVTFGSLSSPYKITRRSVTLWAEAMRRLPDSRFRFVHPNYEAAEIAENIARAFDREGISGARLDFVNNRASGMSHFRCYGDIDIMLDTLPLTGGTTSCDALWMGVPVVTRRGPGLHQRLSHTMLMHCGLADLSADSDAGFVETAIALAGDEQRLGALRQGLRETLCRTTLGDGAAWARAFGKLMETLAERHLR